MSHYILQWHRNHGIDTLFFDMGAAKPCGSQVSGSTIAGQLAPKDDFYCLIGRDIPPNTLQNSSNVLGVLLGDEPDKNVRRTVPLDSIIYAFLLRFAIYCSWMMGSAS